jgi:flagellar basal body-associated protein FliL
VTSQHHDNGNGRKTWAIPGISMAIAVTLCTLAVQATWNMSSGLSSLRLDSQKAQAETAATIAAQGESMRLQIQELRFQLNAQGEQIKEIRDSQKSHPQGR